MNGRWIKAYEGKREKARHALALKRQGETFRTIMAVMGLPCLEVARQLVARGEWQELNPPVPALPDIAPPIPPRRSRYAPRPRPCPGPASRQPADPLKLLPLANRLLSRAARDITWKVDLTDSLDGVCISTLVRCPEWGMVERRLVLVEAHELKREQLFLLKIFPLLNNAQRN
jgi:hypothetical protein